MVARYYAPYNFVNNEKTLRIDDEIDMNGKY